LTQACIAAGPRSDTAVDSARDLPQADGKDCPRLQGYSRHFRSRMEKRGWAMGGKERESLPASDTQVSLCVSAPSVSQR